MVIICLLIMICGVFIVAKGDNAKYDNNTQETFLGIGGTLFVVAFFVMVGLLFSVSFKLLDNTTINQKIEMLEVENADIEVGITKIVGNYMNYEQQTYTNLNNVDLATLVALYPDLKASDLVNKQLTMYYDNKQQVKDLKMKRIDNSNWRFLIYFGGAKC